MRTYLEVGSNEMYTINLQILYKNLKVNVDSGKEESLKYNEQIRTPKVRKRTAK